MLPRSHFAGGERKSFARRCSPLQGFVPLEPSDYKTSYLPRARDPMKSAEPALDTQSSEQFQPKIHLLKASWDHVRPLLGDLPASTDTEALGVRGEQ